MRKNLRVADKNIVVYRKPRSYVPPYNYCDRWCERCRIDRSRCLVYQMETDERLHREIDGRGEPTPEETSVLVVKEMDRALRLLEEQAHKLGVEWEGVTREPPPLLCRSPDPGPLVEEAILLARGVADFLRNLGAGFPEEAQDLRWYHTLVGPKLGRASMPAEDDHEVADAILQAQVAHKALRRMAAALESIRRKRPSLTDGMLDCLALIKRLQGRIEDLWLKRPCALLVAATEEEWWGPLRDITPSLRSLRGR